VTERLVRETHPGRAAPVTLDSPLERDLGLDSLARVELLLRLGHEFGAALPEAALAEAETPRDLLRHLGHAAPAAVPQATPSTCRRAASSRRPMPPPPWSRCWSGTPRARPNGCMSCSTRKASAAEPIGYAELLGAARRIAAGLVARGLRPQQAVALMLPTGRDYLACFFGVLLAGGIPVPIYPPARLAQIEDHLRRHARILDNAQAVFIVTVPQAKSVAALLAARVPSLAEIVTPQDIDAEPMPLLYRARAEDIAFLQYTSGSTGEPKGVVLTHANLLANLRAMGPAFRVSSEDVFVSWLPLYHDMGLIGAWFGSLYFAMPLVLMSPLAFLARPARWLQAISRHRGTLTAAPNFAYELCAKKLDDAELAGLDLSSLRLALNGAEPVSPATLEAFIERFVPHGLQPEAITPVYGLAECSVGLAFPPLGRGPRIDAIRARRFGRDGRAVPVDEGGVRRCACRPAGGRCRATRSASWTRPATNCPSARSAACSSAAPRRRAAISATRRRRRAWSATAGSIRATTPTWSRARSTSPAASRTSSSAAGATSIPTNWRRRSAPSPASARAASRCSPAPIRPTPPSGWW
jgi:acyl-CoA synthetase (AMP-forming)/AMP-acid ligase II/acyl carrier protein